MRYLRIIICSSLMCFSSLSSCQVTKDTSEISNLKLNEIKETLYTTELKSSHYYLIESTPKDSRSLIEDLYNLKAFDIEENGYYIANILALYDDIDDITTNLNFLNILNQPSFTSSFIGSGCYKTLYQIIETYKQSWRLLINVTSNSGKINTSYNHEIITKIKFVLKKIKEEVDKVDQTAVFENIKQNEVQKIENYIKNIFPKNDPIIKNISFYIKQLKYELEQFISLALFKNK